MIKTKALRVLKLAVRRAGYDDLEVEISRSKHADFTSNIALKLGKKLKRDPMEIAREIRSKIHG